MKYRIEYYNENQSKKFYEHFYDIDYWNIYGIYQSWHLSGKRMMIDQNVNGREHGPQIIFKYGN
jgi:hypothetical protein